MLRASVLCGFACGAAAVGGQCNKTCDVDTECSPSGGKARQCNYCVVEEGQPKGYCACSDVPDTDINATTVGTECCGLTPYDCCERCIANKGPAAGCEASVYEGPPSATTGTCYYKAAMVPLFTHKGFSTVYKGAPPTPPPPPAPPASKCGDECQVNTECGQSDGECNYCIRRENVSTGTCACNEQTDHEIVGHDIADDCCGLSPFDCCDRCISGKGKATENCVAATWSIAGNGTCTYKNSVSDYKRAGGKITVFPGKSPSWFSAP